MKEKERAKRAADLGGSDAPTVASCSVPLAAPPASQAAVGRSRLVPVPPPSPTRNRGQATYLPSSSISRQATCRLPSRASQNPLFQMEFFTTPAERSEQAQPHAGAGRPRPVCSAIQCSAAKCCQGLISVKSSLSFSLSAVIEEYALDW
ncbi:hypothetical protein MRX96_052481 [Rhipicephalus microplus]